MYGTLTPCYGRDYASKKEALVAWNEGKDFMLNLPSGGGYINRSGAESMGMTSFQIRWKKMTMVAVIKKSKDGTWK